MLHTSMAAGSMAANIPAQPGKRERLIDSADVLFHRQGIAATSLADIAKHANIPIGNVYYYFKTKEELALAAAHKRQLQWSRAYTGLDEKIADPRERLIEAVRGFNHMRDEFAAQGCPVGKAVADAGEARDAVAASAVGVFEHFIAWAQAQFEQLGHENQSRAHAVHVLCRIEGAAIMAKALASPDIVTEEIERLVQWLQTLPNQRFTPGKVGIRRL